MGDVGRTRSFAQGEAQVGASREPHLFLILEADRPGAAPQRWCLAGVDEVVIGRGARRASELRSGRLTIRVADPWMSGNHARLARVGAGWILDDLGSKNGTIVDGTRQSRAMLADGAIIELGHTFLRLRVALEPPPDDADDATTLVPDLARRLSMLARAARSPYAVLILGETGTGKEAAARAVHDLSRRPGAFVPVNCAAIADSLVISELFGHVKGAFSGAAEHRAGLVRAADRGTLFLDEVAELSPAAQAALLRALQEREVVPVGGTKPVPVDLRVVAATHRDLAAETRAERFRTDLFARLGGFTITMPALRDRREDLGLLIRAILARHGSTATLDAGAARLLLAHDWPMNIRELEQCLGTAAVLATDGVIRAEHLPDAIRHPAHRLAAGSTPPVADDDLAAKLRDLLRVHDGNVSAVARAMGKDRKQIQRWMKKYGL